MIDDDAAMIRETAERLFADQCTREVLAAASAGTWPLELWDAVEETGLTVALVSEHGGGAGFALDAALPLIGIAAEFAAPIPLAETMIAAWLLDRAGMAVPQGPLTIASLDGEVRAERGQWRLAGTAERVPWGGSAQVMLVADAPGGTRLFLLSREHFSIAAGDNIAREPRDTLAIEATVTDDATALSPIPADQLKAVGAAFRTTQIAGALKRVTAMTVQYAQDRAQFGRSLSKFQAIQQNLAVLATQASVASMAATMARDALARGVLFPDAAIAKARAGEAAGTGASIAHQVHGAIGFTLEHDLQFYTKRLYAWRDEFGNEAEWNARYGCALAQAGADGLWPTITAAA